jgi:hypothetical protein
MAELALIKHFRQHQTDCGVALMDLLAEARRNEQSALLENRVLSRDNVRLRNEAKGKKRL